MTFRKIYTSREFLYWYKKLGRGYKVSGRNSGTFRIYYTIILLLVLATNLDNLVALVEYKFAGDTGFYA